MQGSPFQEHAAGVSTRKMASHRRVARLLLCCAGLLACVLIMLRGLSIHSSLQLILCLGSLAIIDRCLIPFLDTLKAKEDRATRGARAEEIVGQILNRLSERHVVLHDIPARYGNIDHLVFRQDGAVFLIETKSHYGIVTEHAGMLKRSGWRFEKDFIKQTHRNLTWLQNFLRIRLGVDPWIHAAIVFPNATVKISSQIRGIEILHSGSLERWIASARPDAKLADVLWPRLLSLKTQLLALPQPRPYRAQALTAAAACAALVVLFLMVKPTASLLHAPMTVSELAPTPVPRITPRAEAPLEPKPTPQPPRTSTLVEIKAAAEQGDSIAQDKFAGLQPSRENAVIWYRKAAAQGILNSQYQLAHILLSWANSPTTKPPIAAMHADEAIPWLVKAANGGEPRAQVELGQLCLEGKHLKKDLPEAYKWLSLGVEGSVSDITAILGRMYRDKAILQMSQAELAEGNSRLQVFKSGLGVAQQPQPAYLDQLRLQGITGVPPRSLAIINGKTLAAGESASITIASRLVNIQCLAIQGNTATVAVEGFESPKTLHLP